MEYTIVLGGGESGMWAALLAKRLGHKVLLSDSNTLRDATRDQEQQVTLTPGTPLTLRP